MVLMPATLAGAASSNTNSNVLYNSTSSSPGQLPGNLPSVGAESSFFQEFGNQIDFAQGSSRLLNQVVVSMSSWGCQTGHWYSNDCMTTPGATFSEPITFNIYPAPTSLTYPYPGGTAIKSVTQTFNIPYRPSADNVHCIGSNVGKWYDAKSKTCFNGLATNIVFDISPSLTVPNSVVYGIAYNTTDAGYNPYGTQACNTSSGGCGYDSLNILLSQSPPNPTVGSDQTPGTVFVNYTYPSSYCDSRAAGPGFRVDSPPPTAPTAFCWGVNAPYTSAPFFIPAVEFKH